MNDRRVAGGRITVASKCDLTMREPNDEIFFIPLGDCSLTSRQVPRKPTSSEVDGDHRR
jgi:hypothetical protein